jgi:hypothetical protein
MDFVSQHGVVLLLLSYAALAAVNSLPDPQTEKFEWYPWFYHTVKQLMNNVPPRYLPKDPTKL